MPKWMVSAEEAETDFLKLRQREQKLKGAE